ncbi:MAG: pyridoxal phosphate-dependent decarboxylase family protein [Planctomycetota bacterium]
MPEESRDRLQLSPSDMEKLGKRVMEKIVARWAGLREGGLGRTAPREEMERLLSEPLPEEGVEPDEVLERIFSEVMENTISIDHPRFLAFIPVPSNFMGFLADVLACGFNVFSGTWLAGSGAAQVELTSVDWLRQMCGMPETTAGLFVSGGSMANLTALCVARQSRVGEHDPAARVYFSDQTHSSVERALTVLGFTPAQRVRIPSDAEYRLDLQDLTRSITEDRSAGCRPFCVVANAGTTNTGAVDPLGKLADLCEAEDLWLHVDGAYGAPAALCDEGRALLQGLDRADSLTLDPHKWLFQPMELGCVLVREGKRLAETFRVTPEYMKDTEGEINFADSGIQLTRSFRALKLWTSLKVFGVRAFRGAVARGIRLGATAEKAIRASSHFEIVTPARLGILTFEHVTGGSPASPDGATNLSISAALRSEGQAMVSTTALKGRTVLRMCTNNPRTTEDDIHQVMALLEKWADTAVSEGGSTGVGNL